MNEEEQPLPALPPEFGEPLPGWWTDIYGPTGEGDPLGWVDTDPTI